MNINLPVVFIVAFLFLLVLATRSDSSSPKVVYMMAPPQDRSAPSATLVVTLIGIIIVLVGIIFRG